MSNEQAKTKDMSGYKVTHIFDPTKELITTKLTRVAEYIGGGDIIQSIRNKIHLKGSLPIVYKDHKIESITIKK